VLLLDSPTTIAESRDQVRSVAAAIGDPAAGEKLVARIDKAVADAAPRDAARPSALLYIADNFANGGPSLLSEMLGKVGFGPADTMFAMNFSTSIPIERLAAHPPRVVLAPNFQTRIATLRRKVLSRMAANTVEARFAPTLMNCGGPTIIEAMQRLAAIRATIAP
jgi:iron complex transport system substrate-binding protein